MTEHNQKNFTNLNKKLYLVQDIYTLIYCSFILPISLYNILYNTNIITWKIDLFSYVYFITTGIINLINKEYDFLLHHLVCLGIIWSGNYNNNLEYYIWVSNCYLSEFSNIFLSYKNILRYQKDKISNYKIINNINNFMFILSYFIIRICWIIPITILFSLKNYKNLIYNKFILINISMMIYLNIYWLNKIFKKIKKDFLSIDKK